MLQIYVWGARSRVRASGPGGTMIRPCTASVLAGFSSRAFSMDHVDTASVQSAIDERSLNMDGTSAVYRIRSSAYWWYCIWCAQTTSSIGDTYIANNSGPRMEPWGTPDDSSVVADRSRPMAMYCDLSETKDCNHRSAVPRKPKSHSARLHSVRWSVTVQLTVQLSQLCVPK